MKAIYLAALVLAMWLQPFVSAAEKAASMISIQLLPTTDEGKPAAAVTSMLVSVHNRTGKAMRAFRLAW